MDRITQSFLKEYLRLHDIPSKEVSIDFEKFVNYSVISSEYSEDFKVEDISTGDAKGIDGIGIVVNGRLITSTEEVDDLWSMNKYIEVLFIFIQSKTSSNFDGSEMGNFAFSVKQLFEEVPKIVLNAELSQFHKLIQDIYDRSPKMSKGKPECKLFYVTTGSWLDDKNLLAVKDNGEQELEATGLFSHVQFLPVDANMIQKFYRKTKENVTATFLFKDKVTLPDIIGVKESYFGILPFLEFMKIIEDDKGKLKNIFTDNIRDYLGTNPVNDKINGTLATGKFDLFSVLNNGVTVVANNLIPSGNRYTINDYQLVNGCQTTHVLYNNRNLAGIEQIFIPFRLIVTEEDEVKNSITIATNSQTAIKPEQLEALSDFQKNLEKYYTTFSGEAKLYYERRTNQYSADDTIPKTKIVSIPTQIKSFASMFLDLPHLVSRYYGTVANSIGEQYFKSEHKYFPYYVSAFALYRLEYFLRNGSIDPKYRKAKFHLLTIFRRLSNKDTMPFLNSHKMENYCTKIMHNLSDTTKALDLFIKATQVIDSVGIDITDPDMFKQKEKTELFLSSI